MYIIDTNKDSNLIVELTQNDNNTGNIEFQILKNGKPLNLTSKKVKLALVKNTTNKGDIITNVKITNPTNGIISVPITTLITRKKGLFVCGLAVYSDDYLENTGNFRLNVKRDIFEDTAEVIIGGSVYSELLKMLEKSDKTITEYKQKINNSIDSFNSTKVETLKNFKNEKDKVITEFKAEGKTEADNREKEWDSLKKIAIEENNAVELQSQINVLDKALKSNQSLEYKSENITCNDTLASRTENLQILGNTKYKRKDESLTDVWEEGVSLESTGEKEKDLINVNSCGKNLIKTRKLILTKSDYKKKIEFSYIKPNTNYIGSSKENIPNPSKLEIKFQDGTTDYMSLKRVINLPKKVKEINLYIEPQYLEKGTIVEDIQVEEGTHRTPYEPYQEDTKQIQLPHPLRKVGDVADRIYEKDGKVWLEQNIGEIVLNGSEDWYESQSGVTDRKTLYVITRKIDNVAKEKALFMSCKFKNQDTYSFDVEGISSGNKDINKLRLSINKSRLETQDIQGFKKWLSENPTTVLYQLKTPIITELNIKNIDLDTFSPVTHITSDNNIQPTLDFKVPSNLASIVQSNSRAINEIYDLIDTLITPQLIQNRLDIDINKFKK